MPESELKRFYIVREHPVRIISKCKSHSKGTLGSFLIGFCLFYCVVSWVPQILSEFIPATNLDLFTTYTDADPAMLSQLPATPLVIILYSVFFSGVFKLSECLYTLTYIRNRKADYRAFTESFSFYLKTLGIYLVQMFLVAFWSLFFIIPGIIVALNFSQAFYILADDPDKSISEVLTESKIMMYGNKMNYLRLLLYYVPYFMIAYIPATLASAAAAKFSLNEPVLLIITLLTDIPIFAARGIMSMGRTVFYELMINKGFADFRYAGQDAFRELETR